MKAHSMTESFPYNKTLLLVVLSSIRNKMATYHLVISDEHIQTHYYTIYTRYIWNSDPMRNMSLTRSQRVTLYCVVEDLYIQSIPLYACNNEEAFLQYNACAEIIIKIPGY